MMQNNIGRRRTGANLPRKTVKNGGDYLLRKRCKHARLTLPAIRLAQTRVRECFCLLKTLPSCSENVVQNGPCKKNGSPMEHALYSAAQQEAPENKYAEVLAALKNDRAFLITADGYPFPGSAATRKPFFGQSGRDGIPFRSLSPSSKTTFVGSIALYRGGKSPFRHRENDVVIGSIAFSWRGRQRPFPHGGAGLGGPGAMIRGLCAVRQACSRVFAETDIPLRSHLRRTARRAVRSQRRPPAACWKRRAFNWEGTLRKTRSRMRRNRAGYEAVRSCSGKEDTHCPIGTLDKTLDMSATGAKPTSTTSAPWPAPMSA